MLRAELHEFAFVTSLFAFGSLLVAAGIFKP